MGEEQKSGSRLLKLFRSHFQTLKSEKLSLKFPSGIPKWKWVGEAPRSGFRLLQFLCSHFKIKKSEKYIFKVPKWDSQVEMGGRSAEKRLQASAIFISSAAPRLLSQLWCSTDFFLFFTTTQFFSTANVFVQHF